MIRSDIRNYLTHLTKGDDSFENFTSIAKQGQLLGGTGYIKGG